MKLLNIKIVVALALCGMLECRPQRKGLRASGQQIFVRGDQFQLAENEKLDTKDHNMGIINPDQVQPLGSVGQNIVNDGRPKEIRKVMKSRTKYMIAKIMNRLRRHRRSIDSSRNYRKLHKNYPDFRPHSHTCEDKTRQEYVSFEFPDGVRIEVPAGCKTLNDESDRACGVTEIPHQRVHGNEDVFATKRFCERAGGLPNGLHGDDHICRQEYLSVKIQDQSVDVESGCLPWKDS